MKKNGFVTFCCACVPGCGQMYQGYMKRGISLMFWFAAVCFVSAVTYVYGFMVLLPVIWAYSFFDTFNLRNLSPSQRATFRDSFIPAALMKQDAAPEKWFAGLRFSKLAGWGMVAIGAIILLTNFRDILLNLIYRISPALGDWLNYSGGVVIGLAIGAAIVLLGIRMLRGSQKADAPDLPTFSMDDDVPPPPPVQPTAPPPPPIVLPEVKAPELTLEPVPAEAPAPEGEALAAPETPAAPEGEEPAQPEESAEAEAPKPKGGKKAKAKDEKESADA